MAADFQNQFQEAMREAEMTDLKKQVDDLAHDIKTYDPLKAEREDVENIGKDLNKDFEKKPLDLLKPAAETAPEQGSTIDQSASAAAEPALPAPDTSPAPAPEPAVSAVPESTERTG
jgi:sec-independent protein translocase protein TatB